MSDQDQTDQSQVVDQEQLERLREALLGTYEVERELGEGGMAIVYLAQDVKHDRQVAIKVLRPELSASLGHERFLREIKIAAKLSHPHILPLYDSGEAGGMLYYVMPFVEGESLADYMSREKQLSVEEAVQITREVAEALSVAHSFGLVHRDIKPENVMMTGGHAVVADFGIALAIDSAGGEKLTQTGMAVGTPAYMSPEQAQGEPNLDGRADIYSLGCMMYEMLVGQIPFTAPTPMAMIARHTMDHPTPISIMRESIPPDLENIVFVAMEKTPADRFRTAQHMVDALKAWEQGTASKVRQSTIMQQRATGMYGAAPVEQPWWKKLAVPAGAGALVVAAGVMVWQFGFSDGGGPSAIGTGLDPASVAVLYFDDRSSDGSASAVADGLTEGLIAELSTVNGLNVISRNGVARFRGSNLRVDSIARVLETGSVVRGSVEPTGDNLRVNVQLLDGLSTVERGGTSFELPATEVLALQDSVVQSVAGFLRQVLGTQVRTAETRAGTDDDVAWLLVQRAELMRADAFDYEEEEPERARQMYLEADSLAALAADRDGRWAEPVTLRGWLSYDLAFSEESRQRMIGRFEEAVRLAAEAIARDPTYADAHHLRGRARYLLFLREASPDAREQERLLDSAQADLQAAVDRDPTLAEAWYALSDLDYHRGDNVSAVLAAREAYEADRFMSNMDANLLQLFETHYDLEQFADADKWCMEGARRFPDNWRFVECQLTMLVTPWADADVDRAWQLASELDSLAPDELVGLRARMWVAGVLARTGRPDSARAVIAATEADPGVDPEAQLANDEAFVHILLGQQAGDEATRLSEQDEAIDLLKRYNAANRGHGLETDRDLHWKWRPLRDNPRFKEVTERGR